MPGRIREEWTIFVALALSGILLALYLRTYLLAGGLVVLLLWAVAMLLRDIKRHKKEND